MKYEIYYNNNGYLIHKIVIMNYILSSKFYLNNKEYISFKLSNFYNI